MPTTPSLRRPRRPRPAIAALALLVGVVAATVTGCSSSSTTNSTATTATVTTPRSGTTRGTVAAPRGVTQISLPKLTVTATEDGDRYLFGAPATVATGWVDLGLDNTNGRLNHQVNVARMKDGVTREQVEAALTGPAPESALAMVDAFIGGPNNVVKGTSARSIVQFDRPGDYVMLCLMADAPDFSFHITHGMFGWITAEGEATTGSAPIEAPTHDATIDMLDFEWLLPDTLPGQGWVELTNSGEQPHELAIYTLKPGRTIDDAKAFIATPSPVAAAAPETTTTVPTTADTATTGTASGTTTATAVAGAPWEEVGGFGALSPKHVGYLPLDLAPGTYLFVCFIPDAGAPPAHDFKPHALHGMIKAVTVS